MFWVYDISSDIVMLATIKDGRRLQSWSVVWYILANKEAKQTFYDSVMLHKGGKAYQRLTFFL